MSEKIDRISKESPASGSEFIDITIPFRNGMVHWPGDQAPRIERVMDVNRGDKAKAYHLANETV